MEKIILEKYLYKNLRIIYRIGLFIFLCFNYSILFGDINLSNLIITIFFFFLVYIIFKNAEKLVRNGEKIKESLKEAELIIEKYNKENENILLKILNEDKFFKNEELDKVFEIFKNDYLSMQNETTEAETDIEKYINYGLIESIINTHFLNLVSGTMTGLGILGTFLGLSFGLNSFNLTGSADEITKEIKPLMSGIKVAFHTSIYGLVYSILFNFYYRDRLKEFTEAISSFITTWQKYVVPVSKNGNEASFIKYQKRINDCLNKQIKSNSEFYNNVETNLKAYHELNNKNLINIYNSIIYNSINEQQAKLISLQEHQNEAMDAMSEQMAEQVSIMMKQTIIPEIKLMREAVVKFAEAAQEDHLKGVQKIVNEFIEQMHNSLGESFQSLGKTLDEINEWQKTNIEHTKELMKDMGNTANGMSDINKHIDEAVLNVAKYTEAVEKMQDNVNTNLMSLNVQAETNNELIKKQNELVEKMISTEEIAKNTFNDIIEKIDKQANSLRDFNSNVTEKIEKEFQLFSNKICDTTNTVIANNEEAIEKVSNKTFNCINSITETTNQSQKELQGKYTELIVDLKTMNNQVLEEIANSNKEIISKYSEATETTLSRNEEVLENIYNKNLDCINSITESTNQSQKELQNKYIELVENVKNANNQTLESIVNTNKESINKISESTLSTQKQLSDGLEQIATSITNTTISIQDKLVNISNKMDKQLETLTEVNDNIKQQLIDEVENFATKINSLTDNIVNDCQNTLLSISESSKDYVGKLENLTLETQNKLQEKFNNMEAIIRTKLEKVGEINGRLVDDISNAATNLGNAANNLNNGLTGKIRDTFATFDKELSIISMHLSGTISNINKTVENTKFTFDLLSQDIDDKFEKMQEHLDLYLEYADKLHHNLEYKWNQLKN